MRLMLLVDDVVCMVCLMRGILLICCMFLWGICFDLLCVGMIVMVFGLCFVMICFFVIVIVFVVFVMFV